VAKTIGIVTLFGINGGATGRASLSGSLIGNACGARCPQTIVAVANWITKQTIALIFIIEGVREFSANDWCVHVCLEKM
jgi:hypothetical protein